MRKLSSGFHTASDSTWWGVALLVGTQLASVVVAVWTLSLLWAGVAQVVAGVVLNIPILYWCWGRMIAHNLSKPRFNFRQSITGVVRSQMLTLEKLVDFLRQQGIRLMLAPLVGTAAVAIFATTRTGANLALQGLSTVTGPLMPELMRFLSRREQEKTELAFGIVWVPLILAMCPGVIVLQIVVSPLFVIWTRGKVEFDPLLFAFFSMSIIVSAAVPLALALIVSSLTLLSLSISSRRSSRVFPPNSTVGANSAQACACFSSRTIMFAVLRIR